MEVEDAVCLTFSIHPQCCRPSPRPGVDYTFGVSVTYGEVDAIDWTEPRSDDASCTISTFGAPLPQVFIFTKVNVCTHLVRLFSSFMQQNPAQGVEAV